MRDKHMFAWRLIRWLRPYDWDVRAFADARSEYWHRRHRWIRFCRLVEIHRLDKHLGGCLKTQSLKILRDLQDAGLLLLWKSVFATSTPANIFDLREWVHWNQSQIGHEMGLARELETLLERRWNLDCYHRFLEGSCRRILSPKRGTMFKIIEACAPLYTIRCAKELRHWLESCLAGHGLPSRCIAEKEIKAAEKKVAGDCQKLIAKAWEWARLFRCLPKEEPVVRTPDEARRALDSLLIAIDAKLPAPSDANGLNPPTRTVVEAPDRGHIDPPAVGQPDDQSEKQQFILAVQRMATREGIVPANDEENGWVFEPGSAIFRGTRFEINGKPFRLLKALSGGKALTAADLKNAGWEHDEDPDDHAIGANLSRLRKLLRTALNLPKDADPVPCLDSGSEKAWQLRT